MKTGAIITLIIVIILAILIIWWIWWAYSQPASSTQAPMIPYATSTSVSDGMVTLYYPSSDFSLATSEAQVPTTSNIPPCDSNLDDCLYYIGNAYQGTNFQSAGLRIEARTDLTTQTQCLTTEPSGYTNLTPTTATSSDYAVSVFPNVGGAAAGSMASDSLYRLYYQNSCYEFETRVAQSDFGNYPSGTIQQFTSDDQSAMQNELLQVLGTLTLSDGEVVVFP